MARVLALCHGAVHLDTPSDAAVTAIAAKVRARRRDIVTVDDRFDAAPDVVGNIAKAATWTALQRRGPFRCVASMYCPLGRHAVSAGIAANVARVLTRDGTFVAIVGAGVRVDAEGVWYRSRQWPVEGNPWKLYLPTPQGLVFDGFEHAASLRVAVYRLK